MDKDIVAQANSIARAIVNLETRLDLLFAPCTFKIVEDFRAGSYRPNLKGRVFECMAASVEFDEPYLHFWVNHSAGYAAIPLSKVEIINED